MFKPFITNSHQYSLRSGSPGRFLGETSGEFGFTDLTTNFGCNTGQGSLIFSCVFTTFEQSQNSLRGLRLHTLKRTYSQRGTLVRRFLVQTPLVFLMVERCSFSVSNLCPSNRVISLRVIVWNVEGCELEDVWTYGGACRVKCCRLCPPSPVQSVSPLSGALLSLLLLLSLCSSLVFAFVLPLFVLFALLLPCFSRACRVCRLTRGSVSLSLFCPAHVCLCLVCCCVVVWLGLSLAFARCSRCCALCLFMCCFSWPRVGCQN